MELNYYCTYSSNCLGLRGGDAGRGVWRVRRDAGATGAPLRAFGAISFGTHLWYAFGIPSAAFWRLGLAGCPCLSHVVFIGWFAGSVSPREDVYV